MESQIPLAMGTTWELKTSYEKRLLEELSLTIEEANLKGECLIQIITEVAPSPGMHAERDQLSRAERIALERSLLNAETSPPVENPTEMPPVTFVAAANGAPLGVRPTARTGRKSKKRSGKDGMTGEYLTSMGSGLASALTVTAGAASTGAGMGWAYAASYWNGPEEEKPPPPLEEPTHSMEIDTNPHLPIVMVQLKTIDGRRVNVRMNSTHRVAELKAMSQTLAPLSPGMRIQLYDWRGNLLEDASITIEDAKLAGTQVRCDAYVGPSSVLLSW